MHDCQKLCFERLTKIFLTSSNIFGKIKYSRVFLWWWTRARCFASAGRIIMFADVIFENFGNADFSKFLNRSSVKNWLYRIFCANFDWIKDIGRWSARTAAGRTRVAVDIRWFVARHNFRFCPGIGTLLHNGTREEYVLVCGAAFCIGSPSHL